MTFISPDQTDTCAQTNLNLLILGFSLFFLAISSCFDCGTYDRAKLRWPNCKAIKEPSTTVNCSNGTMKRCRPWVLTHPGWCLFGTWHQNAQSVKWRWENLAWAFGRTVHWHLHLEFCWSFEYLGLRLVCDVIDWFLTFFFLFSFFLHRCSRIPIRRFKQWQSRMRNGLKRALVPQT